MSNQNQPGISNLNAFSGFATTHPAIISLYCTTPGLSNKLNHQNLVKQGKTTTFLW